MALVDVLDVAHGGGRQARHALVDEAGDAVERHAITRQIGRVVEADLHLVHESVDDRVAVDAGVEIGDHRHRVRRELVAAVGGRAVVLGLARPVLGDRHLQVAARQRCQHVVGAVPGGHDQRPREELAAVRADDVGAAVGLDRRRLDAFDGLDAAPLEPRGQRTPDGRQVDDAAVDVEVRHVRVEVGEPLPQRLAVERLGLQPQALQRLEAELRVGVVEVGRDRTLADVHAAAAHEHRRARVALEVAPQPERLVREARVRVVEVVVAERARAAVRGRHRITDPPSLEHDDARAARRRVVGGEQAHHASADDDQIRGHAASSTGRSSSA